MLNSMFELQYRLLTDEEISQVLNEMPGWVIEEGELVNLFAFNTYKDGLVFAMAVGHLADKLDHHPDLLIGYRTVRVALSTHSVNGLSPYDVELARQIDTL
jgi:4a-hydroxytetrahydrobiopterin dehydratase